MILNNVIKKKILDGCNEAKDQIDYTVNHIFKEEILYFFLILLLLFIPYFCERYLNCGNYLIYTVFALIAISFFYLAGKILITTVSYWHNNGFTLNPYPIASKMLFWEISKRVNEKTKNIPGIVLRIFFGKRSREKISNIVYSSAEPYFKKIFILLLGKTILLIMIYWAFIRYCITPFLAPAEEYNNFTAFFYPFWKSLCFIFKLIRATPWTFLLVFLASFSGVYIILMLINSSELFEHKFLIALLLSFIAGIFLYWFMNHNDYTYTGSIMIIYTLTFMAASIKFI